MIPGQVAREFAKNRAKKIQELFQQLNKKANTSRLHQGEYPLLEDLDAYKKAIELEGQIDKNLTEYRGEIRKVLEHVRQWVWDDPVSLLYGELFTEEVIFDPRIDKDEVQDELEKRQLHSIPPGYKDASKDDSGIGDFLIWRTILEIGKSRKKSLIFVSGDEKADWRYKSDGQTLYPRYELVDEYRRHSDGQSFHIVEFSRLLDLFGASVNVVKEVKQTEQEVSVEEKDWLKRYHAAKTDVVRLHTTPQEFFRWLSEHRLEFLPIRFSLDECDYTLSPNLSRNTEFSRAYLVGTFYSKDEEALPLVWDSGVHFRVRSADKLIEVYIRSTERFLHESHDRLVAEFRKEWPSA